MDKKKKMMNILKTLLIVWMTTMVILPLEAQSVKAVQFCGNSVNDTTGEISLFLKLIDRAGNPVTGLNESSIKDCLNVFEGKMIINWKDARIEKVLSGKRIPGNMTFSVLVDLNITKEGKQQIYDALKSLVESAPDSCVYISFFSDKVSNSELITSNDYAKIKDKFMQDGGINYFYSALYSKMAEFSSETLKFENWARLADGYQKNPIISKRASANKGKNILIVFTTSGSDLVTDKIGFNEVRSYQKEACDNKVFAFYYEENGDSNKEVNDVLWALTESPALPENRRGKLLPSGNFGEIINTLGETISKQMYDYVFTYKAQKDYYDGDTPFTAKWNDEDAGEAVLPIGSPEKPWQPHKNITIKDILIQALVALLATLLTIAFFILIMKALIPWIKSKTFAAKYYKKYVPEANVLRKSCYYCKQDLQPGQTVVEKCEHVMHLHCWKINNYKCAEYGQNCNTGIQEHVEWNALFTKHTLRDCKQTISGILAGLVSWIIYVLTGSGSFMKFLAKPIVNTFYKVQGQASSLNNLCVEKVAAFLAIGFLLGFFLSLVFRYNDEYRTKNWKVLFKIFGLSLLSGLIGMAAFAVGGCILCAWLPYTHATNIPWYCSLPAYVLFSICTALSLTIMSSVPVKSAMLGGLCSAVIGFIVLYFGSFARDWAMLLNFIIYGGGLGASLVTVRALAEKYFLVIQNGVKAGQRIPIHKWMNATGGGNKVTIGMTGDCEIQMNWEKSNKVAKEHAQLYIDQSRSIPVIKPLANGVVYNTRAELPVGKPSVLTNGDTFKIGDTIFKYEETD
jgi:hypothetical protein